MSKIDTNRKIEITGVDLREFIKKVYDLSQPQGFGMLHHRPGGLSDEDTDALAEFERGVMHLDYVHGRACKMVIWRDEETGKMYIWDHWYDHTRAQFEMLLSSFRITPPKDDGVRGWGSAA